MGGSFTEEERLLLFSIAEEIAFAIRNAKLFEYVVSTYCKQRQGQMSCKGCERPLGSWTPCVKYREVGVQFTRRPAKASNCIECEMCLERCPFGVDIIGKMRRAVEVFEIAV